ncbi:jg18121 [Pararge aegeria aegeria]|uniref:Jg18121 protein n=1 Tax=Pararge aegeria aegeria TaxID=348720 RepID=A0A8S4S2Y8_9NEOP|nr:jg18121 [Pararge aegeria aegeria]
MDPHFVSAEIQFASFILTEPCKSHQNCFRQSEISTYKYRSPKIFKTTDGPEARALFKELSKRVIESTGDPRAGSYFAQRISLAIQRGNAASILGTVPRCGGFEDVLDFI